MAVSRTGNQDKPVRLNDVDLDILAVMADGRRYTQQHLYDDVPELDEYSDDWIRKRISHLHDNALIEKVGSSAMYEITDYGESALELHESGDIGPDTPPVKVGKMIRDHADN